MVLLTVLLSLELLAATVQIFCFAFFNAHIWQRWFQVFVSLIAVVVITPGKGMSLML